MQAAEQAERNAEDPAPRFGQGEPLTILLAVTADLEEPGAVRVTADCGLDWTGPRRAWDVWVSDRHAHAHNKGIDGLSACCSGLAIKDLETAGGKGTMTAASTWMPTPVHPDAVALTIFRELPDGHGRQYTAATFPSNPWQGCECTIRMAREFGYVTAVTPDSYATLDVLNGDGDLIQIFGITTSLAFSWFYRKLRLRVESEDGR